MDFQDIMQCGANLINPQAAQKVEDDNDAERIRQQRIARAQAGRLPAMAPAAQGPAPFMNLANAAMAPGMAAHSGAVGQVNDAISREMQSRVAQQREARRMQHEKDMLAMSQQGSGVDRSMVIRALISQMGR